MSDWGMAPASQFRTNSRSTFTGLVLRRLAGIDAMDIRVYALVLAMIIYGAASSPTPDDPGVAEILIGLCLVLAAGFPGARGAVIAVKHAPLWHVPARVLFLFGLSVPVLTGLAQDNSPVLILRDILPFLFMLMPLFLARLILSRPDYAPVVTMGAVAIGLFFSWRVLIPLLPQGMDAIRDMAQPADPFYLVNAPTVLFAAIFLLGTAGERLYRAYTLAPAFGGILMACLGAIPVVAMAAIMQRAHIGYLACVLTFLLAVCIWKKPGKALIPLMAALSCLFVLWPEISSLFTALIRKTELVGLNMRAQEAMAVFDVLDDGFFLTMLLGKGWGATFHSPAVGNLEVNFTHSLVTAYWLKTGLAGVVMCLVYLGCIVSSLMPVIRRYPVVVLALAGPILIDIFLYASYKSLDFGIILLLACLWAESPARLKIGDISAMQGSDPHEDTETE